MQTSFFLALLFLFSQQIRASAPNVELETPLHKAEEGTLIYGIKKYSAAFTGDLSYNPDVIQFYESEKSKANVYNLKVNLDKMELSDTTLEKAKKYKDNLVFLPDTSNESAEIKEAINKLCPTLEEYNFSNFGIVDLGSNYWLVLVCETQFMFILPKLNQTTPATWQRFKLERAICSYNTQIKIDNDGSFIIFQNLSEGSSVIYWFSETKVMNVITTKDSSCCACCIL